MSYVVGVVGPKVPGGRAEAIPDHLARLLFSGDVGAPGGRFVVSGQWSVDAGGPPDATLLAAGHEYMHEVLNEFSLFGQLLITLGIAGRFGDEWATDLTMQLLRQCRTAHEAYATFTSVVLSGVPPTRALADYPGYDAYYRSAAKLSGGLDPASSLAAYHIAEIALSECFAAPFPPRLFTNRLSRLRPVDLPVASQPDRRFMMLRNELPPLIPAVLERIDQALRDAGTQDVGPSAEWGRRSLDDRLDVEEAFTDFLRAEIRAILRGQGAPVLGGREEELEAAARLKEAIRRDYPDEPEVLALTWDVPRSDWHSVARSATEGERIVFRRPPKQAIVTVDLDGWAQRARERGLESIVAVVTTPARLREQFQIQPADWREAEQEQTVVWLVDPDPGDEPLVPLWPASYADLDRALRRIPGFRVALLVRLSTVPGEEWWEDWGERLQERGDLVLYGDTALVELVHQSLAENHEVTYSVFRISEDEHLNGVVIDAGLPGPILWLGSGITRALLVRDLRETASETKPDDSLTRDDAIQLSLRYIVNHECATGTLGHA